MPALCSGGRFGSAHRRAQQLHRLIHLHVIAQGKGQVRGDGAVARFGLQSQAIVADRLLDLIAILIKITQPFQGGWVTGIALQYGGIHFVGFVRFAERGKGLGEVVVRRQIAGRTGSNGLVYIGRLSGPAGPEPEAGRPD